MTDYLDLPGWTTTRIHRPAKKEVIASAVFAPEPAACLKCGVVGETDRWGTKDTELRDSPVRGERVTIDCLRRRYRCRACRATFLQPLGGTEEVRRMTTRCRTYIEEQSLPRQFTHVANDVGADEKTVRQIAMAHIAALNKKHKRYAPRVLGLDETKLDGHLRVVVIDLEKRRPIDMLATYSKASVHHYLSHMPNNGAVQVIVTDMAKLFREAVKLALPGVPIVVDKWHVLRAATGAINTVQISRKREAKTKKAKQEVFRGRHVLLKRPDNLTPAQAFRLDGMLKNDPDLKDAYEAKDSFFRIWDSTTKAQAAAAIDAWLAAVPVRHAEAFVHAVRALNEWRDEVLAFWDHKFTNAYTENRNHAAKEVNRAGRGYSFEVIRARVLFGLTKPEEDMTQCQSCFKLFDPSALEKHHIVPIRDGRRPADSSNIRRVCANCHRRIYTEKGK